MFHHKISVFFSIFILASFADAANLKGGCLIAGSPDAQISIQEFADFECKFCVRGANTMLEILKNYTHQVNLVFRNRPLPFHAKAHVAAEAFSAVCLQSSTLAYTYQKELFENQDRFVTEGEKFLYELADKIGVDLSRMKSDMKSKTVALSIAEDKQLADGYRLTGTPSFLVGKESVVGAYPFEHFKKIIDRQLGQ